MGSEVQSLGSAEEGERGTGREGARETEAESGGEPAKKRRRGRDEAPAAAAAAAGGGEGGTKRVFQSGSESAGTERAKEGLEGRRGKGSGLGKGRREEVVAVGEGEGQKEESDGGEKGGEVDTGKGQSPPGPGVVGGYSSGIPPDARTEPEGCTDIVYVKGLVVKREQDAHTPGAPGEEGGPEAHANPVHPSGEGSGVRNFKRFRKKGAPLASGNSFSVLVPYSQVSSSQSLAHRQFC